MRIVTITNAHKHHEDVDQDENMDGDEGDADGSEGDEDSAGGEEKEAGGNDLDSVPCQVLRV